MKLQINNQQNCSSFDFVDRVRLITSLNPFYIHSRNGLLSQRLFSSGISFR